MAVATDWSLCSARVGLLSPQMVGSKESCELGSRSVHLVTAQRFRPNPTQWVMAAFHPSALLFIHSQMLSELLLCARHCSGTGLWQETRQAPALMDLNLLRPNRESSPRVPIRGAGSGQAGICLLALADASSLLLETKMFPLGVLMFYFPSGEMQPLTHHPSS